MLKYFREKIFVEHSYEVKFTFVEFLFKEH